MKVENGTYQRVGRLGWLSADLVADPDPDQDGRLYRAVLMTGDRQVVGQIAELDQGGVYAARILAGDNERRTRWFDTPDEAQVWGRTLRQTLGLPGARWKLQAGPRRGEGDRGQA